MPSKFLSKLRYINPEMLAALARTAGQVLGGVIAKHGWAHDDEAMTITGALVTILLTLWGVWARRDKALIESAASLPAVHSITIDKATEMGSASLSENQKVN